jgi:hypothetical protein
MPVVQAYWTAQGTGISRAAVQITGIPYAGEIKRVRVRAPVANAATGSFFYFGRIVNTSLTPQPGWLVRPGAVDPATVDQLNLAASATGKVLTQSATLVSDSTVPNVVAYYQGELWLIVDMTAAVGAWTVNGIVDILSMQDDRS